jgi:fructosamine-3-kinase
MPDWPRILSSLRQQGIAVTDDCHLHPVGGGNISKAWKLQSGRQSWFLKTGPARAIDMFEAEAEGLRELQGANAVRVPESLASGVSGLDSYLLLEWIDLERRSRESDIQLGERLATQHRCLNGRFGWHRDNTIGATPQCNDWHDDWVEFYRHQRLGYQLELAIARGYGPELQREGASLMLGLERFFKAYRPAASLLHGDLWGGNYASSDGQAIIYDPAVYFGDRETDLAMTRLFGGFGDSFYRRYAECWPLPDGHEQRLILYQLYHVLNHLNLFGAGYLGRAMEMLRTLNQAGGISSDSSTR